MAKQPLGNGKYYPHDTLKRMWLDGAPLGEWCDCVNKRYLQREDAGFKAFVSYCPFHGFDTSCYICDRLQATTEQCNRDHQLAPFVYKGMWEKYGKPIPTQMSLAEAAKITLAEASKISAEKYLNI